MITAAKLKTHTVKDLAAMAKKKKVPGWHAMRKDELIQSLVKQARSQARKAAKKNGESKSSDRAAKKVRSPQAQRRLNQIKARARSRDLSFKSLSEGSSHTEDRLVAMVRDPYWLHAYWELSRSSIERAEAAMGQYWHGSRPVLRVYEVARNGTTSTSRRVVRDIEIHGGVNHWYIDVQDPPKSFQLDIGYLADGDHFHSMTRSNIVTTPLASGGDAFDANWAEVAKDYDRVYALSGGYGEQESNGELKEVLERQLRRPMGDPMVTRFGLGASPRGNGRRDFAFEVGTELIVHGTVDPDSHVTLRGEPVPLRPDGSFAVRFTLPNRRHVLPVVASSGDGVEQRTIVLAVDRNTKVMEPVIRSPGE